MIKIKNLAKAFGSKKVLQNISVDFKGGKVYGIVGANGAGKTTFFRCIAGLENYQGEIISIKQPIKDYLGFLQTTPFFFSKMTGREYLQLLINAKKLPPVDFDEQNIFDLPLDEYVENYSTGMKKKIAILGLLFQKNDSLILDEPFNGVDIQSNMIITEIIHQLKKQGKTILIASHIFSTLSDTCDEIFLLEKGTFTHQATPEQFAALDDKMKQFVVGDRVGRFFDKAT